MTLAEFERHLDVHGTRLSVWPDDARTAAAELLAIDPAARGLLQETQRLDRLIVRSMSSPKAVDAAATRVLARLGRELPPQRRAWLSWPYALLDVDLAPSRLRIAALAGMAALGLVLGLFGPDLVARDSRAAAGAAGLTDINLAAVFEPEPLTGVTP